MEKLFIRRNTFAMFAQPKIRDDTYRRRHDMVVALITSRIERLLLVRTAHTIQEHLEMTK